MTFQPQVQIPAESRSNWERAPTVSSHNLHECELFQDDALAELLEATPKEKLFALHMGHDPLRRDENQLALHDGLSGHELLRAVKNGRLWLNVTGIHTVASRYSALSKELYRQVSQQVPGFKADITTVTVLISSPRALVYYHVDGPANMLWHIRGEKRIWIYPPEDRWIRPTDLEDIFAGVAHEYIPYQTDFDSAATVYDLKPGQLASWAPNSPHRVTNLDSFNVSLSTEHYTDLQRRKARVYRANRMLRNTLGLAKLSTEREGVRALAKQVALVAAERAGYGRDAAQKKRHVPKLRVAPDAPNGVVPL